MNGANHSDPHGGTWERVGRIRTWLDDNAGELTERERVMMPMLKISDEVGEVSEAMHGDGG
ncbi:hypothetical protein ACWGI0_24925 [Streptomyces sp. NPDC054802]